MVSRKKIYNHNCYMGKDDKVFYSKNYNHIPWEAVFNCQNGYIWDEENPHATKPRAF